MEKYKHTFAGNSSDGNRKFEDDFEIIFDDSEATIAVSKDEYTCGLDNKTVYYRIVVRLENARAFCDDNDIYGEVYLIPSYRSIHKKHKESIFSSIGDDKLDMNEWGNSLSYFLDATFEGTYVQLGWEKREYEDENDFDKVFEKMKSDIVNTFDIYHGLIGFYLDAYANRIGYTGWDYLRMWCNNLSTKTLIKEIKKRHNL